MTERRRFIVKAGGVLAVAGAATIADAPSVIAQPKIKWRMSTGWTAAFDIHQGAAERLAKVLEEMSGGRFRIEVFPGGQIMPPFECFDAASKGTIEAFMGSGQYWADKEPALEWFTTIPFGFEDEMVAALGSGEIDAAAATATSIGWYNHEHPGAELAIVQAADHEPELAWDLAVGMRRSDRFLRREIDRIIAAMLEDGTVARVYAAYGVEHRPPVTRKPELVRRKTRIGEEGCVRLGNTRDCSAVSR